jgi:hypothetical protein
MASKETFMLRIFYHDNKKRKQIEQKQNNFLQGTCNQQVGTVNVLLQNQMESDIYPK